MAGLLDPIDPSLLHCLDTIRLRCRRGGHRHRARSSTERYLGATVEIEGYHRYGPGDDLRFLDWPSYLRLDQLLVREFRKEHAQRLHLLLDSSRSMVVPEGDGKFAFAVNLAALLAYVALASGDAVRVVAFCRPRAGAEPVLRPSPLYRHRASFVPLRGFLSGLEAEGQTALRDAVRRYLERRDARGGTAVIISDFLLPPAEVTEALAALRRTGHDVVAIEVTGARERRLPPRPGWYRLRDAETGEEQLVWVSRRRAHHQLEHAGRHAREMDAVLGSRGVRSARAPTDQGAAPFLLHALPALGLAR